MLKTPPSHTVSSTCASICVCAEISKPDHTGAVLSGIVLVAVVFVIALCVRKAVQNKRRTAPLPTVNRMITPVATIVDQTSISVPVARETGIRSALTSEAEMIMPSISSADNFANVPVATALPAADSANMPVATARYV